MAPVALSRDTTAVSPEAGPASRSAAGGGALAVNDREPSKDGAPGRSGASSLSRLRRGRSEGGRARISGASIAVRLRPLIPTGDTPDAPP